MLNPIILKPGRDKSVRLGHPWIFSGAIASGLNTADGGLLPVQSEKGEQLGWAYAQSRSSIAARMVSFGLDDPYETLIHQLEESVRLRRLWFKDKQTTGYRLINGEGDFLPGLVVDQYGDCLVVQSFTLGMDKLLKTLLPRLYELVQPQRVLDKSIAPSRKSEGLKQRQKWLLGDPLEAVSFTEYGLRFLAEVTAGQKTGFFIDQREMRQMVRELAAGRRVLNCFSYTGAFTIAALAGGAVETVSVDVSEKAMATLQEHLRLNDCPFDSSTTIQEDVFTYLRKDSHPYDLVILDPPAFAKKRHDTVQACRGYKDINRLALRGMPTGSFLLTSSCSHYVDESLFQKVVFQAAAEAGRAVRIIGKHRYAYDHPVNLAHPEGQYLKSLLLLVS